MESSKILKTARQKVFPGILSVCLHNDGIIEVIWDNQLEEIKVSHLQKLRDTIEELGEGNKMPVYISTCDFLKISEEAKKYASSPEGERYTLANAVLVDNLAKKIVFNFFININKPKVPIKAFHTKESALKWLKQLQFN